MRWEGSGHVTVPRLLCVLLLALSAAGDAFAVLDEARVPGMVGGAAWNDLFACVYSGEIRLLRLDPSGKASVAQVLRNPLRDPTAWPRGGGAPAPCKQVGQRLLCWRLGASAAAAEIDDAGALLAPSLPAAINSVAVSCEGLHVAAGPRVVTYRLTSTGELQEAGNQTHPNKVFDECTHVFATEHARHLFTIWDEAAVAVWPVRGAAQPEWAATVEVAGAVDLAVMGSPQEASGSVFVAGREGIHVLAFNASARTLRRRHVVASAVVAGRTLSLAAGAVSQLRRTAAGLLVVVNGTGGDGVVFVLPPGFSHPNHTRPVGSVAHIFADHATVYVDAFGNDHLALILSKDVLSAVQLPGYVPHPAQNETGEEVMARNMGSADDMLRVASAVLDGITGVALVLLVYAGGYNPLLCARQAVLLRIAAGATENDTLPFALHPLHFALGPHGTYAGCLAGNACLIAALWAAAAAARRLGGRERGGLLLRAPGSLLCATLFLLPGIVVSAATLAFEKKWLGCVAALAAAGLVVVFAKRLRLDKTPTCVLHVRFDAVDPAPGPCAWYFAGSKMWGNVEDPRAQRRPTSGDGQPADEDAASAASDCGSAADPQSNPSNADSPSPPLRPVGATVSFMSHPPLPSPRRGAGAAAAGGRDSLDNSFRTWVEERDPSLLFLDPADTPDGHAAGDKAPRPDHDADDEQTPPSKDAAASVRWGGSGLASSAAGDRRVPPAGWPIPYSRLDSPCVHGLSGSSNKLAAAYSGNAPLSFAFGKASYNMFRPADEQLPEEPSAEHIEDFLQKTGLLYECYRDLSWVSGRFTWIELPHILLLAVVAGVEYAPDDPHKETRRIAFAAAILALQLVFLVSGNVYRTRAASHLSLLLLAVDVGGCVLLLVDREKVERAGLTGGGASPVDAALPGACLLLAADAVLLAKFAADAAARRLLRDRELQPLVLTRYDQPETECVRDFDESVGRRTFRDRLEVHPLKVELLDLRPAEHATPSSASPNAYRDTPSESPACSDSRKTNSNLAPSVDTKYLRGVSALTSPLNLTARSSGNPLASSGTLSPSLTAQVREHHHHAAVTPGHTHLCSSRPHPGLVGNGSFGSLALLAVSTPKAASGKAPPCRRPSRAGGTGVGVGAAPRTLLLSPVCGGDLCSEKPACSPGLSPVQFSLVGGAPRAPSPQPRKRGRTATVVTSCPARGLPPQAGDAAASVGRTSSVGGDAFTDAASVGTASTRHDAEGGGGGGVCLQVLPRVNTDSPSLFAQSGLFADSVPPSPNPRHPHDRPATPGSMPLRYSSSATLDDRTPPFPGTPEQHHTAKPPLVAPAHHRRLNGASIACSSPPLARSPREGGGGGAADGVVTLVRRPSVPSMRAGPRTPRAIHPLPQVTAAVEYHPPQPPAAAPKPSPSALLHRRGKSSGPLLLPDLTNASSSSLGGLYTTVVSPASDDVLL
ncbi:hypothetical protein DIPPA_27714 [Diplonema papillatum]|nr:hypothetical protein DIPPA_27714 [Diplonema papillatum]